MAKRKNSGNLLKNVVTCLCLAVVGLAVGLVAPFYALSNQFEAVITTDVLTTTTEVFYSKTEGEDVNFVQTSEDLSIHFLELGNKYTGDCTFIKVNNVDILIDCGSKSSSIATVANYLNNYVTDGKLEYVIVTHAHQDHYAGFATTKVNTIFDLYQCENIITFAKTNQKETASLYSAFKSELQDEINNGANHFTALDCYNNQNGAQREYNLASGVTLEILYHKFYEETASTENDYSVCVMINQGERKFLFTGDLEEEGEESLAETYAKDHGVTSVDVEVYKAGHHGSKTSTSNSLLNVFHPKVCAVCCCAGSSEYTKTNANQFPTQDFINRIAPYTDKIYVTTLCIDYKNNEFTSMNGNIVVLCKTDVTVSCTNNNTLLKDTDWFKNNRTKPSCWE